MTENYDATWYPEPPLPRYGSMEYISTTPDSHSHIRQLLNGPLSSGKKIRFEADPALGELLRKFSQRTQTKENPVNRDDIYYVDDAVRKAIDTPRREAEVAKRVAAVQAIAVLEDSEIGTVLRFKRKYAKNDFSYAVIKTAEDMWFVTGNNTITREGYSFEQLLTWMTTGENLVSEVQIATAFNDVTWTPAPAVTETIATA